MHYILAFLLAFALSFLGMMPPGMINITSVNVRMKKGIYASLSFLMGASVIEFFQALVSIQCADTLAGYFVDNTIVQWGAVLVFVILGLSFLLTKVKKIETDRPADKNGHSFFIKGAVLSLFNVLVYPFWIAQGIIFLHNGWLHDSWIDLIIFSLGVMLGTASCLYGYVKLGHRVLTRFDRFSKNINQFLALVFFILAVIQLWQLYT